MMKIYLDPGHGGSDPGAEGNGLQEKNITLVIAKKAKEILEKEYERVTVRMSRIGDQTKSLMERTNDANKWGADFYLSIHINAGGGKGYEDFIHNKLTNSSQTAQIREIFHTEVMKTIHLYNRGKKKANFHVLRETKMPAILTESGFIDNLQDSNEMKQELWIDQIAYGHVRGLCKGLGLIKKTDKTYTCKTYLRINTDTLWTYYSADWDDRAVHVRRGEVFTVIKDKFKVGRGAMYQIKSGLYISAHPDFVEKINRCTL